MQFIIAFLLVVFVFWSIGDGFVRLFKKTGGFFRVKSKVKKAKKDDVK